MRSVVKWMLIVVGAIVAAGIIGGAIRHHGKHKRVPPRNPIPLGQSANLGAGWKLEVLRVSQNAARAAKVAEKAHALPSGTQYFLIKLAATYVGHGKGDPSALLGYGTEAVGPDGATYDGTNATCGNYVPQPALGQAARLAAGQTARGYDCYEIPVSAAKTLLLHTGDFSSALRIGIKGLHQRWFALR